MCSRCPPRVPLNNMPIYSHATAVFSLWIPVVGIAVLATVTALLSLWESWAERRWTETRFVLALVAILVALLSCAWQWLRGSPFQLGFISFDRFGMFFSILLLGVAFVAVLQIQGSTQESRGGQQLYAAPLFSVLGAILMVTSTDLVAIYMGLVLATLPLIVWVGRTSRRERDHEIRMKYWLTAGLALAFFAFGLVFLYVSGGTTSLNLLQRVGISPNQAAYQTLGIFFVLIGLAFKLALVPFHFSVPDLYEGGATVSIGFMSVISKVSALAVLLRLLNAWWNFTNIPWVEILSVAAVLALIVGHLSALSQTNFKRRLAYGSIGQVGFFLIAMAAAGSTLQSQEQALTAILYYAVAFSLMSLGAFAVVLALGRRGEELQQDTEYAGLAKRAPMLAAALALFLASLAGLPPTAGFIGKFYILKTALDGGNTGLAVLAFLAWVLSAYYYLEIIQVMYFKEGSNEPPKTVGLALLVVLVGCVMLTLYWGILPNNILTIAGESARALLY